MIAAVRSSPPVQVADGVTVEERTQGPGECSVRGSDAHVFVLQCRPVTRAQQTWEGARREGPMRSGEVSLLPAGLWSTWRWAGEVASLHVAVAPAVADALGAGVLGRSSVQLPAPFALDDPLARQQLEALRVQAAAGGGDPLRAEMLVQRLLVHLGGGRSAVGAARHGLPPGRLAAVLDHLEEHLTERVTIRELASVAGVEVSWLTRLFHDAVGCSPYQYLLERRVVRAQHLLRAGRSPAAAAAASGFVDQAHLTRHFRRRVGTTPGAWAAAVRSSGR